MTLNWAHPFYLLGILAIALVAALLLQRMRRHSRRWRVVCLVLPALAAALLVAVLAGPDYTVSPRAGSVVLLLDLSGSARDGPWRNPHWLRQFAAERLPPGAHVTVVGFSRDPKLLLDNISLANPAAWPVSWQAIPDEGSQLAPALAWRTAPDDRRPRWLFTDGLLDLSPLASPETDVALTVLLPADPDMGIVDLRLQSSAAPAPAATELQVYVRATGPARAAVQVRRAGVVLATQPAAFAAAGTQLFTFTDRSPLPESPVRYDVELTARTDRWPENDHASILSAQHGPPSVLLVTPAPPVPAATQPGLTPISPASFPTTLAALAASQIVVLDDLPTNDPRGLSADSLDLLDRFVRDTGGGLLILGRQSAFGPGGYPGTKLDALSPLASAPPERPPAHVIFILDASGSMGESSPSAPGRPPTRKFNFVTQGIADATRTLRDTDRITAVVFGADGNILADGAKSEIAAKLSGAPKNIIPNGPTNPDAILDLVAPKVGQGAIVVLLTDGEIPKMDTARWATVLGATQSKLTLVAPAPTDAAPSTVLVTLSHATSTVWFSTSDASQWPALLQRAVEEPLVGKSRKDPTPWHPLPPLTPGGTTTQWIETWPKPEATLRAASTTPATSATSAPATAPAAPPQPLAATAQRGLGKVAAVAFADSLERLDPLLQSLFTEIAPPPGDRRFTVASHRTPTHWEIRVNGREGDAFLNGLKFEAQIIPADGREPFTLALAQNAPGEYTRPLPETTRLYTAIVKMYTNHGASYTGKTSPPALPAPEWPANATVSEVPIADHLTLIPTDSPLASTWRPRNRGEHYDPRPILCVTAGIFLVAALWLRRGR